MASAKKTILIVEDEPVLRMVALDMVEAAGFDAIEAANANEAIAILEKREDIRIVFSDIDMRGGMDGIRLAEFIRKRWPPVDIVLTSGHILPEAAELPERSRFFSKPYKEADVVSVFRAMAEG